MFNVQQLIGMLLQRNPAVANNPQARQMLEVIQSGDNDKGQEIANNILQSRGISKDDALNQAHRFFGL